MGILRSVFGPSKQEIWSQIADEIGGEYIEGGFWKSGGVRYVHGEWELLLDTYTVQHQNGSHSSSSTYTRLRAPFVNKDGLYFKIYREGFFSKVGKFFGMQDLEIGDEYFDCAFVIKGNHHEKIRKLLDNAQLKELIDMHRHISLQIKDDEGWFGEEYPDGADVLSFSCLGVVKDRDRLKSLFFLFSLLLERLVQVDSAYDKDPQVKLNP